MIAEEHEEEPAGPVGLPLETSEELGDLPERVAAIHDVSILHHAQ